MDKRQRFSMFEPEKVMARVIKRSITIAQVTPINQIRSFPKLNTPRCNINLFTTRIRSQYMVDSGRLPRQLPPIIRENSRKIFFCGSPIKHLAEYEDNNEKSISDIIKELNN